MTISTSWMLPTDLHIHDSDTIEDIHKHLADALDLSQGHCLIIANGYESLSLVRGAAWQGRDKSNPIPPPSPTKAPRPLLPRMSFPRVDSMAIEPAPGSPPDLTNSKSSKSSSFQSSGLPDLAGPNDISHFEDITLDDVRNDYPQEISRPVAHTHKSSPAMEKRAVEKRPAARSAVSLITKQRNNLQAPSSFRDLTNGAKPRYPSLKGQVNGVLAEQNSLALPNGRSMRRGFTSPSTPTLSGSRQRSKSPSRYKRSRSPSPVHRNQYVPSRSLPRSDSSSTLGFSPKLGQMARRQSWQTGPRKTTKELEDEIDDKDEELPEDAIVWNIPISPRPPHERSASQSPSHSLSSSPASIVSGFSPKEKHISAPASFSKGPGKSPRSANRPSLPLSPSLYTLPETGPAPPPRSKTWADLSPEVRSLTEALEAFAEMEGQKHNESVQKGSKGSPSVEKPKSTIELPPVRKGDIMIDPLPISKEKEKCLSRTRPSWLPPKDPAEERKHLREYKRMMAHAIEAEKRKAAKLEEEQHQRDQTALTISRIWDEHVLPNWNLVINEPRTRELWWRGVTPRSRGVVWQRAVGNELELSETSYAAALKRAKTLDSKLAKMSSEERRSHREAAWFDAIRRDSKVTLAELKIFQAGGPLCESLLDVLMAYAMYRSDVGYVYGTHQIAALLLVNLPAPFAFIALANLLNRPLPMAFLINDTGAMSRTYDLVLQMLAYKIPALHHHLVNVLKLPPEEYLDPVFRTLFCGKVAADVVARIWDVWVFEGDKALVRSAVGVLAHLEGRLYSSRQEIIDLLGWESKSWDLGTEDEFMTRVRNAGKA